jgi:hypothetical protein
MAAAAKTPTMKNMLGRVLRETGAAMKESGRSEVRRSIPFCNLQVEIIDFVG